MTTHKIIWTGTDEAPALATYSLLPIIQGFTKGTDVAVETRDISLAGRIIANFPDYLTESQRIPDYLSQLGELALTAEANIIKLPNISARSPSFRKRSGSCRRRATSSRIIPRFPRTRRRKRSRRATPRSWEAPSIRCSARGTRTGEPLSPSRIFPRSTPISWAPGPRTEGACLPHDRRRFLRQRKIGRDRRRRRVPDRAGRGKRDDDGSQGQIDRPERRDPRRNLHEPKGLEKIL